MSERDWQADWNWVNSPDVFNLSERAQEMLVYWLRQVRELEKENRKLRDIVDAAKKYVQNKNALIKYSEMGWINREPQKEGILSARVLESEAELEKALAALDGGERPQTVIVTDDSYPD